MSVVPIKPFNMVDAVEEYRISHGLTTETFDLIGARPVGQEALAGIIGKQIYALKALGGLIFPSSGQAPCEHWRARVFYVEDPIVRRPLGDLKPTKQNKYLSQSGAPNYLFMPPLADVFNPNKKIKAIVVEAELGAAYIDQELRKNGYADNYRVVSLSGFHNTHVHKQDNSPLIPLLASIGRSEHIDEVIIMPDSDYFDKPNVMLATDRLCEKLIGLRPNRSNTIKICIPRAVGDEDKAGPDDFLKREGMNTFLRLLANESKEWENNDFIRHENKWIERYIFTEETGLLWDCVLRREVDPIQADRTMMGKSTVRDIRTASKKTINYDHKSFLRSAKQRMARGVRFNPSSDEMFYQDIESGLWYVNQHDPKDIPTPIKGDVSIIHELLDHICCNSPTAKEKFILVNAYHAQNPALVGI